MIPPAKGLLLATACFAGLSCAQPGRGLPQLSTAQSDCLIGALDLGLVFEEDLASAPMAAAMGALMAALPDPDDPAKRFLIPSCSGIQVSDRHVLTAAHCNRSDLVFNKRWLARGGERTGYDLLTSFRSVRLRYQGELVEGADGAQGAPGLGEPVYLSAELDFALFEARSPLGGAHLDLGEISTEGDALVLYGYPNGLPLTRADGCTGQRGAEGGELRHDCDALPGSSGGLLVNERLGRPVGLHLQGPGVNESSFYAAQGAFESTETFAERRGCAREAASGEAEYQACVEQRGSNRGVSLGAILERLGRDAPSLRAALTGER